MKVSTRKIEDIVKFDPGQVVEVPRGEVVVEASTGQKIHIQENDGMFKIRTLDGVFVLAHPAQNIIKVLIVEHYGDLEKLK